MLRTFLAIPLPDPIRSALTVQQFLLPMPRRVEPAGFHLTLVFLGEQPDRVLEAAHEGFEALRMPAFDLELRGLGLFGGARPRAAYAALAPSDPLARLQAKAERVAHVAGASPESRRFVPHVTLGRFAPPPPDEALRLERAVVAGAGFRAGPFAVNRMVLYRSVPGPQGPQYDALADYPFAGGGVSGADWQN